MTSHILSFPQADASPIVPALQDSGDSKAWRQAAAPLFSAAPIEAFPGANDFSATAWVVGPFIACRATCIASALHRQRRHILLSGQFSMLYRMRSGRVTGLVDQAPFDVREGGLAIQDYSRPFEAILARSEVEAVFIPNRYSGVNARPSRAMKVFDASFSTTAQLHADFDLLFGDLERGEGVVSRGLLNSLVAFGGAALQKSEEDVFDRSTARRAQKRAIAGFIEDHLESLDLSAALILQKFGVSRATLYRLFESDGGVRTYILDRRLFRAAMEIAHDPTRRGQIQYAARRWGFSSGTHFNRAVRRRFGVTPGCLFRTKLGDEKPRALRAALQANRHRRTQLKAAS